MILVIYVPALRSLLKNSLIFLAYFFTAVLLYDSQEEHRRLMDLKRVGTIIKP
jgi:hypothetical protein